jgi:hypothetical protein
MRAHANQEFQSGALVQSRPAPRLLVVEDEVLVWMMLAEELRDAGFPVLEALMRTKPLTCCVTSLASSS